jgi:hypothetical protein
MLRAIERALVATAGVLVACSAGAQQVGVLAGAMDVVNVRTTSYAWEIEYRQTFAHHLEWTFSWLNEGHPDHHHRDGFTTQAWLTNALWDPRLIVAVGAGPYRFFDTVPGAGGSKDLNDWGAVLSFTAGWQVSRSTILRATVDRTFSGSDIATHTYMFGISRILSRSRPPLVRLPGEPSTVVRRTVEKEVMAFAGRSIVNTFHSEGALARGVEFRHGIRKFTDWTLTWLNEGKPGPTERDGLAGQAWLERPFSRDRLVLGVGAGPYLYLDRQKVLDNPGKNRWGVAGLVSLTASWRFGDRWFTRLNWNRVASFYDRDADVIVLGIGATTSRGW